MNAPLTVQSNTLADPITPSPLGTAGMTLVTAGFSALGSGPTPSDCVYSGTGEDSVDIIPDVEITAIGMRVLSWPFQLDVTVRVYGSGNAFLGGTVVNGNLDGSTYVGILGNAGEVITRVNLQDGFGGTSSQGVDNISMFRWDTFYINDQTGFDTGVSNLTCLGTEDFEASTLVGPTAMAFDDALSQGVPNGPFPGGLGLPVRIQSSTSGDPAVTAPRGAIGLALAEAGFAGLASDGLLANYAVDGLDLIMLDPTILAVSFNTIGYSSDSVEVSVYGVSGSLLGQIVVDSDIDGSNFMGYFSESGEYIARIHLSSLNGLQQGIDNLRIYSPIPEPAMLLIMSSAGLPALLRRRKSRR